MPLNNIFCRASRYGKVHYTAKYEKSRLAEHFQIDWGPAYLVGVICPPDLTRANVSDKSKWGYLDPPFFQYVPPGLKSMKLDVLKHEVETCIKLASGISKTNNKPTILLTKVNIQQEQSLWVYFKKK